MSGDEFRIRLATKEDAASIHEVLRESFGPFEELYTAEAFGWTILNEDKVLDRFNDKGAIWTAEIGGVVVGTVSVVEEEDRLYIRSMAVALGARRRGIAGALVDEIERFAASRGLNRLYLYTTPFLDGAIRLYEKHGFVRGKDVDGFFGTPLFEMSKELEL